MPRLAEVNRRGHAHSPLSPVISIPLPLLGLEPLVTWSRILSKNCTDDLLGAFSLSTDCIWGDGLTLQGGKEMCLGSKDASGFAGWEGPS